MTKRTRTWLRLLLTLAAVGLYGSCRELDVTAVDPVSVEVTPTAETVGVGEARQFEAVARDASGNELRGRSVSWSVADDAVAQVNGDGTVTGMAPGTTTLTASIGGATGQATVTVVKPPVATVEVEPASTSLEVGGTVQLEVTLRAEDGDIVTGPSVTFTSADPAIAEVSGAGLVTAVSDGTTTITATADGESGQASITVVPKPATGVSIAPASPSAIYASGQVQLTATAENEDGTTITDRPVTWSAAPSSGIVSISTSGSVGQTATVTASGSPSCSGAVCSVTITATLDNASDDVTLEVRKVVTEVTVTPSTSSIEATGSTNRTVQLTAALVAGGQNIAGAPGAPSVDWESSDPAIATVDGSGLVQGAGAACGGSADRCSVSITARVENDPETGGDDANGTATVDVLKPVATVTIEPPNQTMTVGEERSFQAIVKAADGASLPSRPVSWSANPGGIVQLSSTTGATIDAEAVANGSVTLTATAGGQQGQSTVEVGAAIADIQFDVASPTLMPGQPLQINATPVDGNGDPVPDERVEWGDVPGNVMQLQHTPDGRSATITLLPNPTLCEAGIEACTETITVTAGPVVKELVITWLKPVDQVLMSPLDVNLSVLLIPSQRQETFTVELFAADGTQLDAVNRTITWSVSSNAVQISPTTGPSTTATANQIGQATLSAVAEGVTSLQSAVINVGL